MGKNKYDYTSFFITAWWEKINDSPQPRWKKLANRRFVGPLQPSAIPFTEQVEQLTDMGSAFSFSVAFLYLHSFIQVVKFLAKEYFSHSPCRNSSRERQSFYHINSFLFLFEIWLIVQISYHA